jgi:hypothetical protein
MMFNKAIFALLVVAAAGQQVSQLLRSPCHVPTPSPISPSLRECTSDLCRCLTPSPA